MSAWTDSIYESHLEEVAEILGTNPTVRSLAENLAWERRQRRRDLATIARLERLLSPPLEERDENPFAETMEKVEIEELQLVNEGLREAVTAAVQRLVEKERELTGLERQLEVARDAARILRPSVQAETMEVE